MYPCPYTERATVTGGGRPRTTGGKTWAESTEDRL